MGNEDVVAQWIKSLPLDVQRGLQDIQDGIGPAHAGCEHDTGRCEYQEWLRECEEDLKAIGPVWDQIGMAQALAAELSTGALSEVTALDVLDALAVAGLQLRPAQPLDPAPVEYEGLSTLVSAAYFEGLRMTTAGIEIVENRWWLNEDGTLAGEDGNDAR